jgi:hypothetical protein
MFVVSFVTFGGRNVQWMWIERFMKISTNLRKLCHEKEWAKVEKDFGQGTLDGLKRIGQFDPDKSWTPVPEDDE